ncbi:hypothetical protein [Myxosarcina sp. GI1(2024)]
MPFILTAGEFVPDAGRPDGDSIRFRPDNPTPLFLLPRRGRPPRVNSQNGTIQLRYEGIDTMESRAAAPFSSNATSSNLELCGVPSGTGTARGHILSTQIGPNGRPICFVYAGNATEQDGASIFLDVDRMKESVNFKQLSRGHAYPLFYDTLFFDLRRAMADEAVSARASGKNVWSEDATNTGATYSGRNSLETMPPIFPKLWRRLDTYSRDSDVANPESLNEFIGYLNSLREERVFIVSEGKSTGFDDLIEVNGDKIRMTTLPEDIIIVSV